MSEERFLLIGSEISAGGFAGGSPNSLGGGIVADVFAAEDRAVAMAVYTFGPVFGGSEYSDITCITLTCCLLEHLQSVPQSVDL
jgi:hypothetical protein